MILTETVLVDQTKNHRRILHQNGDFEKNRNKLNNVVITVN
jgi:hypothetical protein